VSTDVPSSHTNRRASRDVRNQILRIDLLGQDEEVGGIQEQSECPESNPSTRRELCLLTQQTALVPVSQDARVPPFDWDG